MLHDNMNISRLMVHARRVEETRSMRKERGTKRVRSFDNGSTKKWLEIQDNPIFKNRLSNQVPSKFPNAHEDRVPKPRVQKGRSGNSLNEKPTCSKFGKKHYGGCLLGMDKCFGCRKIGHKMRDFPYA